MSWNDLPSLAGAQNLLQTAVTLVALGVVALVLWALYRISSRLMNAVSFASNALYASPFLVFTLGAASLGFALGDMPSDSHLENKTLAAHFISCSVGDAQKAKAMDTIKEMEEKIPGSATRSPVYVPAKDPSCGDAPPESSKADRLLSPALDGGLVGLGGAMMLAGLATFFVRWGYKRL